ncbi:30S ribosomal protein S11 [Candidatus Phytoplasma pini]|uniref:Small ribosomal subunit protein uS11 n=1 Tax=Candidatus Phytoplasma pini TaxID=267362 RepID=A0A559KJM4_9MOLU|nr:30S ribosomal protein S11 [Candidatus Phytoplasma pini]TVY12335.1 small subunit ribosomal protein S11 [Candidatus Phytoplasma pini]
MNFQNKTKNKRKKNKKNVVLGIAHIHTTYSNTIISITNPEGDALFRNVSGGLFFKGRRKATSFAAQKIAKMAADSAIKDHGMKKIEVKVNGFGLGRDTAIRSLQESGLIITSIKDVTRVPHNGCRPPKRPRG